jgi:drug/metabolite transporter, DME family
MVKMMHDKPGASPAPSVPTGAADDIDSMAGAAGPARPWLGIGLVVLATAFWAAGGVFISAIFHGSTITPLGLAFWRVFCTFLCLLAGILVFRPGLLRVARRDLPWLAGSGALAMGSFQVLWIIGLQANGLSLATVLQCNAPILVTLLAWLIWREALTWRKWAAIGLAFAGTFLIARPASAGALQVTAAGLIPSLAAALALAGVTLFAKKLSGQYSAWTTLIYTFGFAALALLPFQIGKPLPASIGPQAVGGFVALVLFTTIGGYSLYYTGLGRLQASVASIVAMTEVPFAAFYGYIFLGERMDFGQILGAAAVVSGVVLLSVRSRPAAEAEAETEVPPAAAPVS